MLSLQYIYEVGTIFIATENWNLESLIGLRLLS